MLKPERKVIIFTAESIISQDKRQRSSAWQHNKLGIYVKTTHFFKFPGYLFPHKKLITRKTKSHHATPLVRAIRLARIQSTTRTNTVREIIQHLNGHLPVDASIGDTDTLEESGRSLGRHLLVTLVDIRLDHDTDDGGLALSQLIGNLLGDDRLVKVVLLGVTVGAINHEDLTLLLSAEGLARTADALTVVVGTPVTATQNDETVLVTGGLGDRRETLLGHTEEAVGVGSGTDSVDGDAQVTVRAVLVADREGETGGQLTVELGFGGAGADSAEGDEVGKELWGDGVEHLGGDGETGAGEIDVELAGDPQTLVNVVGLVDIGVVDQTLPADGRAGLLEVGAHDDAQVLGQLAGELLQATGVLERGVWVVDRAGADHDEQAVIALLDNLNGFITAGADSENSTLRLDERR